MLSFKPGVKLKDLTTQAVCAIMVAEGLWDKIGGVPLVVTSCNDGKHKPDSLHYKGQAVDLRIHNVPAEKRDGLVRMLKSALIDQFDVLWEYVGTPNEHVHVEYDPKG